MASDAHNEAGKNIATMGDARWEAIVLPHTRNAADPARSNLRVLALCQTLYTLSISVDLTVTGLVGYQLAADKAFATLPLALITVAAAPTTVAASALLQRIGRRKGFALGALAGVLGGLISVESIRIHAFWLFCCGTIAMGVYQAFARYYRLAAADAVAPARKAHAISTVLMGSVVAAIVGPVAAIRAGNWLPGDSRFAGSYALVAMLGMASMLLLWWLYHDLPDSAGRPEALAMPAARPLRIILRQPTMMVALASNITGYGVMMFIMTATPLAVVAAHHSVDQGAAIIQWHLIGMYAPSFFTGRLIECLGVGPVLLAGVGLNMVSSTIAMDSNAMVNFYAALACLGVGWNLMFVAGSTLLTRSYEPNERAKTTAVSEGATFAATALASLAAGVWIEHFGWAAANAATLPMLAATGTLAAKWLVSARRASDSPVVAEDALIDSDKETVERS